MCFNLAVEIEGWKIRIKRRTLPGPPEPLASYGMRTGSRGLLELFFGLQNFKVILRKLKIVKIIYQLCKVFIKI
jgi:hypothetical protein